MYSITEANDNFRFFCFCFGLVWFGGSFVGGFLCVWCIIIGNAVVRLGEGGGGLDVFELTLNPPVDYMFG